MHGIIGSANKEKLKQQAQKAASNYVYATELKQAIDTEKDPMRKLELEHELSKLHF